MTFRDWYFKTYNGGYIRWDTAKSAWDYQQKEIDKLKAELAHEKTSFNLYRMMFEETL